MKDTFCFSVSVVLFMSGFWDISIVKIEFIYCNPDQLNKLVLLW